MRRVLVVLLATLAVVLTVANVGLWRREHCPTDRMRELEPAQVESIEHIDLRGRKVYPEITDRDDIALICQVYSSLYLQRLPEGYTFQNFYAGVSTKEARRDRFVFHLTDGGILTVDNPFSMLLRIGGDWYYASCGEAFGYKPIFHPLNDLWNAQSHGAHRASGK